MRNCAKFVLMPVLLAAALLEVSAEAGYDLTFPGSDVRIVSSDGKPVPAVAGQVTFYFERLQLCSSHEVPLPSRPCWKEDSTGQPVYSDENGLFRLSRRSYS